MVKQVVCRTALLASATALIAGCNKSASSYSLLDDGSSFKQTAVFIPSKIDILWVIDNSGSMETSQTNLTNSFQSFINRFQSQNFDFHMAVTTTEAYRYQFGATTQNIKQVTLRDGRVSTSSEPNPVTSGVRVMTNQTQNLTDVFRINATQGINGDGDERAFESFRQALLYPSNMAEFRRDEAFLAVIIVSDEEDFSTSQSGINESYNNSNLYSVDRYVDFLKDYTGGGNFSVNTISVIDESCRQTLSTSFPRKLSPRLKELATKTGGLSKSLCANFGDTLSSISDSIIQLSAVFKLGREPVVESIVVKVDGVEIAQDAVNGWTYNATDLTITFHGSSVPGNNSNVSIDFFPKSIKL